MQWISGKESKGGEPSKFGLLLLEFLIESSPNSKRKQHYNISYIHYKMK